MKKLLLLGLIISLCLYIAVPVYAASIGGAETQGKGKIAVGVDQDFVFNRDMKHTKGAEGVDWGKVNIDSMSKTTAKISYGLFDNVDVYTKLGIADAKMKGKANDPWLGSEADYGADTNNAFVWGLGAKATYEFKENWLLGIDAQYLRDAHNGTNVSYTGADNWKAKYVFQEWQVAPYVATRIGDFVPYLGMKYSDLRVDHKDANDKLKFKADNNWGVFTGLDYKMTQNLSLNVEGRFVDETAMSLGATWTF